MNKKRIELYVVTHKEFDNVPEDRVVIGVGNNRCISVANIYDNNGDNIAYKNPYYCELTALYWMWKNSDADIIGLEHYRRFFLIDDVPITKEQVYSLLNENDVIVPYKWYFSKSIYEHYKSSHIVKDLDLVGEIIKDKYPQYIKAFNKLKKTNSFCGCNMMICRKDFLDNYCKWLFDIFGELEGKIDLSNRDDYQKRVFGFISERLLNVYLWANKQIKIKEIATTAISKVSICSKFKANLKFLIRRIIKKK
jgi:hypothetical protein